MLGKTQTNIKTVNYTYQVEGIEEIIVPAGTFRCFRVVQYDDAGNPISTQWESGRVRQYKVKSVDHETGEVIKLISLD